MEQPDTSQAAPLPQILVGISYEKKWELLKPFLRELFFVEEKKISAIAALTKERYAFVANEAAYKYRFKSWNWKKNVPSSKKSAMCDIHKTRASAGKSTAFGFGGREVAPQKLRRHLKASMRRETTPGVIATGGGNNPSVLSGPALLLGNSVFLNWNIPYEVMRSLRIKHRLYFGPSPSPRSAPSDVEFTTPKNRPHLRNGMPSPLSRIQNENRIQNEKLAFDRACMFIQSQHAALVKSLKPKEKEIMSTWLYQFWLFAFKTAKNWGRGPREWNVETLQFSYGLQAITQTRPPINAETSNSDNMILDNTQSDFPADDGRNLSQIEQNPSSLCRWSIHCAPEAVIYGDYPDQSIPDPNPDPLDEKSWQPWPDSWKEPPFPTKLLNGLASNKFSNVKTEDLPIAIPHLIKASGRGNKQFLTEAHGFSIMARNQELVGNIGRQLRSENTEDLNGHYPLHLATSFLDGSKSCCNILVEVCNLGLTKISAKNGLGHTVLDSLMMTILKSHTSMTPGAIDIGLKEERRFPGEEVDICGRWDADSDCIRSLIAAGRVSIPFEWKHKFCHTSAQTICHCIAVLGGRLGTLFSPSGLFLRHCSMCGLKLQLQPLHVVVIVAFNLANSGCDNEDLFGIIAILLSMLNWGANPLSTASMSLSLLFDLEKPDGIDVADPTNCDHKELTPSQLAEAASLRFINRWPRSSKTGWNILCFVLRASAAEWRNNELPLAPSEDNEICDGETYFGHNRTLVLLWSAIQTEMLTYRRQNETDPWVSSNFNMELLERDLAADAEIFPGGYAGHKMKLAACDFCGRCCNGNNEIFGRPHLREATDGDFSNLDRNWSLLSFIG